ncbi:MAG: RNase P modulator RnpM [Armatimonadota bacterium]
MPQRRCVACGASGPKRSLLRVVRSPDGAVSYDPTWKAAGRGAYVCCDLECVEKALRTGALSRSLKVEVPDSVLGQVRQILSAS